MDFKDVIRGKTVIVGIGNILKGDDGLGPALVESLKGKTSAVLIDAGTAPESYTGRIIREKPDTVLFVDAVHLDRPPGAFDILRREEILKSGLTTHDLSPRMLIEYLTAQTQAEIYLLGVQPHKGNIGLGDGMSREVTDALKQLEQLIGETNHA